MEERNRYEELSDRIWDAPELMFQEFEAAALLEEFLEGEGFTVRRGVAGLETAFTASYGSGHPFIGILGEYDALPFLSQEAGVAHQAPIVPGGPGHGCGHNLLGVAGVEAVVAIKRKLESGELNGTICYYGCPAEEGGSGKVTMAQAGLFDQPDICLAWHPGNKCRVLNDTKAAIIAEFQFEGKSAHAAANPWDGRSAYDGIELMNVGIQFLREHVQDGVRIHYEVTNTGGPANVVPQSAAGRYIVRAARQEEMVSTFQRLLDIAKGAALMTGTTVSYRVCSQYSQFIRSRPLDELVLQSLEKCAPIAYNEADITLAEAFAQACGERNEAPVLDTTVETNIDLPGLGGSTDVADVSWFVPVGHFSATTWVSNSRAHSWVATAMGKSSFAKKGMHFAARVFTECAEQLMRDPELIQCAKADHLEHLAGRCYTVLIQDKFEEL